MGRLDGKVIVATASAQGIGRATVEAFSREGATVYATDINEEKLKELAGLPGVTTSYLDVTNQAQVDAFFEKLPRCDVLFNCAGYVHQGNLLTTTEKDFDLSMNINVKSMFFTCKAAVPKMLENGGGSIVNMASVVSSVKGAKERFAYGISKAGVIGLTKSIAAEYVQRGIRCNAICPGTVETPSLHDRINSFSNRDEARKNFIARQPIGRFGRPEEIAALCVYLASDESSFTTGSEHVIDGGWSV